MAELKTFYKGVSRIVFADIYEPALRPSGNVRYSVSFPMQECPTNILAKMPRARAHVERTAIRHPDSVWAGTIRAQATVAPLIVEKRGRELDMFELLDNARKSMNIPFKHSLTNVPAALCLYTYKTRAEEEDFDPIGMGLKAIMLDLDEVRAGVWRAMDEARALFG